MTPAHTDLLIDVFWFTSRHTLVALLLAGLLLRGSWLLHRTTWDVTG